MTDGTQPASAGDGKIICKIDGARTHSIALHIKKELKDPAWTVERYQKEFPGEPLLSDYAKGALAKRRASVGTPPDPASMKPMFELFDLPADKCKGKAGNPIMVQTRGELDEESKLMVPDVDPNYVFHIEDTKTVLMALHINDPLYIWGMHGTGKTTILEQVAARTGRPFMRVQHTENTEEREILGQWGVVAGETVFMPGPLPMAMMQGFMFCADEYDVAIPSVTAVYQPVLEGKALVIKDAPLEMRVIRPHPEFRFAATGNTNGCGDETGLYQGTKIQNAANYSRFLTTIEARYHEPKIETAIVAAQSRIRLDDAGKLITFATEVRKAFAEGRISSTISPRELISAAKKGFIRGNDWRGGLQLAFGNRLSRTDREVCDQFAQRVFG